MRLDIGLVTGSVVYRPSTITSACLKPSSTLPLWKYTRLAMFDGLVGFGSTFAVNRSSCRIGASSAIAASTSIT